LVRVISVVGGDAFHGSHAARRWTDGRTDGRLLGYVVADVGPEDGEQEDLERLDEDDV